MTVDYVPSVTMPATCTPGDTLRTAAQRMTQHQLSRLAVHAGARVVAVISEREMVRAIADGADPSNTRVDEYAIPLRAGNRAAGEAAEVGDAAWWLEGLDGNWRY